MNFKSVVIIMDEANPSNPALVIQQDINGDVVSSGDQVDVIDSLIGEEWVIAGVGNFHLGAGVYQNVLFQPYGT
jgi:hypothetical protein